jgi:hypothetical protein
LENEMGARTASPDSRRRSRTELAAQVGDGTRGAGRGRNSGRDRDSGRRSGLAGRRYEVRTRGAGRDSGRDRDSPGAIRDSGRDRDSPGQFETRRAQVLTRGVIGIRRGSPDSGRGRDSAGGSPHSRRRSRLGAWSGFAGGRSRTAVRTRGVVETRPGAVRTRGAGRDSRRDGDSPGAGRGRKTPGFSGGLSFPEGPDSSDV